jgi:hypothetical protein
MKNQIERADNLANFIRNSPETTEFLSFKEKIGLTGILLFYIWFIEENNEQ